MKRLAIHVFFWAIYILYDTMLHFTWMVTALPGTPEGTQIILALLTAFALLPIKLLLVYYIINVAVKKIFRGKKELVLAMLSLGLVFILSMLLFRIVYYYVVFPYIYSIPNPVSLFNSKSVIISFLEMCYVGGIAFALKLYQLQIAAHKREKNLTKEKLQTELKFLRNQTNPHFLFNTLNNIYALARKKSDKTPGVVMKLSELLSFMVYESGKDLISIEEEIKMMEDYIDLQQIRYSDRLSINFLKKIDDCSQCIAPLLLLPLVENAFKHGISETRFDSFVNIHFSLENRNLEFCIENSAENGNFKNENGQVGLNNLKRQLELLYKEHNVQVDNNDSRFKVKILINLASYG